MPKSFWDDDDKFLDEPLFEAKSTKTIGCAFIAWFIFCAGVGLGFLGLVVWAIIKLVNHFTG